MEYSALGEAIDQLGASARRIKAERDIAVKALERIRDHTKSSGGRMRAIAVAALVRIEDESHEAP